MLKHLFVVGLVLSSGAAFAQKQIDCSKLPPAELRMVEDPKNSCGKAKPKKEPEADWEMQKAWADAKKVIINTFKHPTEVQFRNVKGTFKSGVFCGEVNGARIYNGNEGFKIFFYMTGQKPAFKFEDDKDFNASQFAKVCTGEAFELFPVKT